MKSLVILFFLMTSLFPCFAAVCGRIEGYKGEVEILRIKSSQNEEEIRQAIKVKNRINLDCRDVIVTLGKSRIKIRFKGGSQVTLGPHSRISIEEYATKTSNPTLLNLTYGKVRALFKDEDSSKNKSGEKSEKVNQSLFKIKTPTAVAGVRGTDFYVSFEPNTRVTEQATITGKVEVSRVSDSQTVLVDGGNQVRVFSQSENHNESNVESLNESMKNKLIEEPILKVEPIKKEIVAEIQTVSLLVANEKDFTSSKAKEILGDPESWTPSSNELPFDLKELKEEF